MSEVRVQRTDDGRRKTEAKGNRKEKIGKRGQMTDVRSQSSEDG